MNQLKIFKKKLITFFTVLFNLEVHGCANKSLVSKLTCAYVMSRLQPTHKNTSTCSLADLRLDCSSTQTIQYMHAMHTTCVSTISCKNTPYNCLLQIIERIIEFQH